jgi:hypothetical protein
LKLEVVRGTTAKFALEIRDENGNLYVPSDGDVLKFGIRGAGGNLPIFFKEITEFVDGVAVIVLNPSDTVNWYYGVYYYDASLQTSDGFYNIIPYSQFVVKENVTVKESV